MNPIRWFLLIGMCFSTVSFAQDIDQLETDLDEAIRSACHGYMVDALPDAVVWLREKIYAESPFCRQVNAAYDEEALGEAVQSEYQRSTRANDLDLSRKYQRDLSVTIECEGEYMCIESRMRYFGTPSPISLAEYNHVNQFCRGRYGCIEAFFDDWPKPLPDIDAGSKQPKLSFSTLMAVPPSDSNAKGRGGTAAAAVPSVAIEQLTKPMLTENQSIRQSCSCSLGGRACFDNPYGPIRSHIAQIEQQRREVCEVWQGAYGRLNSSEPVELSLAQSDIEMVSNALKRVDERGNEIIALAQEDFEYIRRMVRQGRSGPMRTYLDRVERITSDWAPILLAGQTSSKGLTNTKSTEAPQSNLVKGPKLSWADARIFCQSRGMRLPTIAMARARIDELQAGDPWFGVWTSEQTSTDQLGNMARTFRTNNGDNQAQSVREQARVFCFP